MNRKILNEYMLNEINDIIVLVENCSFLEKEIVLIISFKISHLLLDVKIFYTQDYEVVRCLERLDNIFKKSFSLRKVLSNLIFLRIALLEIHAYQEKIFDIIDLIIKRKSIIEDVDKNTIEILIFAIVRRLLQYKKYMSRYLFEAIIYVLKSRKNVDKYEELLGNLYRTIIEIEY